MNRPAWTPKDSGLEVNEYRMTGLQTGNQDLADSCQWTPQGEPERVPLLVDAPMVEAFKEYRDTV